LWTLRASAARPSSHTVVNSSTFHCGYTIEAFWPASPRSGGLPVMGTADGGPYTDYRLDKV
jgi:hypothetical protein